MSSSHVAAKLQCLDAACRDALISHLDFRVLYLIASLINRATGDAWPHQATMADALDVTRRSVQISLERLSQLGYLVVEVQRGRGHGNRYRLSQAYARGGAQAGPGQANDEACSRADKCEGTFADVTRNMRTPAHENANPNAVKCAPPFAQTPFHNPFKTPSETDLDLEKANTEGVWVNTESPQADAWRRYWRAQGQLEPVRSNRMGRYARRLPSAWPPEAVA
jgi:DNA-binding transcriptional MocR family regulator